MLKLIGHHQDAMNRTSKRCVFLAKKEGNEITKLIVPYYYHVEDIVASELKNIIPINEIMGFRGETLKEQMKKEGCNVILCNPVFKTRFEIREIGDCQASIKIDVDFVSPMKGAITSLLDICNYIHTNGTVNGDVWSHDIAFHLNVAGSLQAVKRITDDNYVALQ